jgi:hypothetical protein
MDLLTMVQVDAHLKGNVYPPMPQYLEQAIEAVENCREGNGDAIVTLPTDIKPLPNCAVKTDAGYAITSEELSLILNLESLI